MLAAKSAWTILRTEHLQLRQRLASIAEAARAVQRGDPAETVPRLRQLLGSFQAFDQESHRPKGITLMDAMRGRSPDADRLLSAFEQQRDHDDALLTQAIGMLELLADGDEGAAATCVAVLTRHRENVLRHLDQEDTLLCMQSERLLTEEEWSRVVSSISATLYPSGPESGGSAGAPGSTSGRGPKA